MASRAESGRVVVVPLLLGPGRVLDQVPNVLTGLNYLWDGRPVLPDSRIADWVMSQVESVTGASTRAAGAVTGHVVDSSGARIPSAASAQQDTASRQSTAQQAASQPGTAPDTDTAQSTDVPLTFLDSVTVTATLRPAPVRETPGMVSVIDSQVIQERLIETFADLVKYEPGVYVESHVTRLGLNGFNIRGIGGNRVMTQVDGVQRRWCVNRNWHGPVPTRRFVTDRSRTTLVDQARSSD